MPPLPVGIKKTTSGDGEEVGVLAFYGDAVLATGSWEKDNIMAAVPIILNSRACEMLLRRFLPS